MSRVIQVSTSFALSRTSYTALYGSNAVRNGDGRSQLTSLCRVCLSSTIPQPILPEPFPYPLNHLARQPMPHAVLDDHILCALRPDVHLLIHLLPKLGRDEVVVLAAKNEDLLPDIRVDCGIMGPVVDGAGILLLYQLPQGRGECRTDQFALAV